MSEGSADREGNDSAECLPGYPGAEAVLRRAHLDPDAEPPDMVHCRQFKKSVDYTGEMLWTGFHIR